MIGKPSAGKLRAGFDEGGLDGCLWATLTYPCREASGVVFTYIGPKDKMPLLPNYDWLTVPSDRVGVTKFFIECNYLQALEGDCDTSHVGYTWVTL